MTTHIEITEYQRWVHEWMLACFGEVITNDTTERNHRFLEEALELAQANGCTRSEAAQLVDYVFNRPVGELAQEAGGVFVTFSALCSACDISMERSGNAELVRIWQKIDSIREKQANKPKHSPLPQAVAEQADNLPVSTGGELPPLCADHAQQWFTERPSLPRVKGCVVCALIEELGQRHRRKMVAVLQGRGAGDDAYIQELIENLERTEQHVCKANGEITELSRQLREANELSTKERTTQYRYIETLTRELRDVYGDDYVVPEAPA